MRAGLLPIVLVLAIVRSYGALPENPSWTVLGDKAYAEIGASVAFAGDVNGDGFDDVLVGAPYYAPGGRAYLYLGSASGPEASPAWTIESGQSASLLGASVSSAGDVNGDGYADVLVGVPSYNGVYEDSGRVLVFHGSPAGLPPAPSATLEVPVSRQYVRFGASVAGVSDVNGDGFDDIAVSAPGYDPMTIDNVKGVVFVFFGSAAGVPASPSSLLYAGLLGPETGNVSGPVSGAGDVNGDGLPDIVAGGVTTSAGRRVYVWFGPPYPSVFPNPPSQSIAGLPEDGNFGAALAGAGDVNGDGFDDVLIGASAYSSGVSALANEGAAYLHLGSPSGLAAAPAWSARGGGLNARLGSAVAGGDLNGDGRPDLIAGAPGAANGGNSFGRAAVFFGAGQGPALAPWWAPKGGVGTGLGTAVAGGGDVNGDGRDDMIIGNPSFSGPLNNQGVVYAYLGAPTPGPEVDAGSDQLAECTAAGGASVAFSGVAVPGPGGDVETFDWFKSFGTPGETLVGSGSAIVAPLALGGHLMTLRATDAAGDTGFDDVVVTVRDTIPPALSVIPARSVLWPPNHRFVEMLVSVQASDACGMKSVGSPTMGSSEPADAAGLSDGSTAVDFVHSTGSISLRAERDEEGSGRTYLVTYRATDIVGNTTDASTSVSVPHDVDGVSEPLILHLEETAGGTVLHWSPVPGAIKYNVIRGVVTSLSFQPQGASQPSFIELGPISCLAGNVTSTDTSATPDPAVPAVGTAFYYMAEYDDGSGLYASRVGYGTDSAPLPRINFSGAGNCP